MRTINKKFFSSIAALSYASIVYSAEVDEKFSIKILSVSTSKNTLVINRGSEDGLNLGEHAKFFQTDGMIARAVASEITPTRSVWTVYRMINPNEIEANRSMSIKIASPMNMGQDPERKGNGVLNKLEVENNQAISRNSGNSVFVGGKLNSGNGGTFVGKPLSKDELDRLVDVYPASEKNNTNKTNNDSKTIITENPSNKQTTPAPKTRDEIVAARIKNNNEQTYNDVFKTAQDNRYENTDHHKKDHTINDDFSHRNNSVEVDKNFNQPEKLAHTKNAFEKTYSNPRHQNQHKPEIIATVSKPITPINNNPNDISAVAKTDSPQVSINNNNNNNTDTSIINNNKPDAAFVVAKVDSPQVSSNNNNNNNNTDTSIINNNKPDAAIVVAKVDSPQVSSTNTDVTVAVSKTDTPVINSKPEIVATVASNDNASKNISSSSSDNTMKVDITKNTQTDTSSKINNSPAAKNSDVQVKSNRENNNNSVAKRNNKQA